MKTSSPHPQHTPSVAKPFSWAALAFYLLIAFEFFYMAGPFAAYFYSVYQPGLDFLGSQPSLAWLSQTFLPHIVTETASPLINAHNVVGAILAIFGFLSFCIGAAQVYYYKLARKGPVRGGIYNFIRHPQYVSFVVCSFGMLLLWPRYIVLVSFVTMLFVYYFLAKIEERECEQKFGQSYRNYKAKTHMFLPCSLPASLCPKLPESGIRRYAAIAMLFIVTQTLTITIAMGINTLAQNSLYAIYTEKSVSLSVNKIDHSQLEEILDIATSSPLVQTRLEHFQHRNLLNYVLPAEWQIAEIPMKPVSDKGGHYVPQQFDNTSYRVVFTLAETSTDTNVSGKEILQKTTTRTPIVEAVVDLARQQVTEIIDPKKTTYDNIPVPIY
jgi:protein-S-isoprenylcysteine O-methyltransferase Ste14